MDWTDEGIVLAARRHGEASAVVQVFTRAASPELYRSRSGRRQLEESLANQLGDRIAKLFYKHVPDEIGSRLQPQ